MGVIFLYPDYPFSSHFAKIDGHRLHYLDEGSGPVIVMVHGNPTWSYYYRHLVSLLAPHFRVIVPDHIGCGLSDKPQEYPYRLADHIRNLQGLLTHLKVTTFSLIVHDWGGAIGMGVAGVSPEAVERIVVLNTGAFRSQRIPFRIRICRWPILGALIVRGLNGFAWPASFMAVTRRLAKDVAAAYLAPYDSWAHRVAVHGFVRDIPLDASHPSYQTLTAVEAGLEDLARRKIPMLICWGGKDFCFNDHFYGEWCSRFPEADTLYLPEAGHYVLEDGLEQIRPRLKHFFGLS